MGASKPKNKICCKLREPGEKGVNIKNIDL